MSTRTKKILIVVVGILGIILIILGIVFSGVFSSDYQLVCTKSVVDNFKNEVNIDVIYEIENGIVSASSLQTVTKLAPANDLNDYTEKLMNANISDHYNGGVMYSVGYNIEKMTVSLNEIISDYSRKLDHVNSYTHELFGIADYDIKLDGKDVYELLKNNKFQCQKKVRQYDSIKLINNKN